MRLVFGGKQLYIKNQIIRNIYFNIIKRADDRTIKDYSIEAGSTMLMVLQLRGGF